MRWPFRLSSVDHLMGSDELCERLGIDRQQLGAMFMSTGDVTDLWGISSERLTQVTAERGEPQPIAVTKGGKIYLRGDVLRAAAAQKRPLPE